MDLNKLEELARAARSEAFGKMSVGAMSINPTEMLDLIALVRKQERELSAAHKANDILLEQSNEQVSEIERLEATGKESLHVGELPALPSDKLAATYTAEQMHTYGRACIAAARPAIWYEGCDTALAHKAAEGTAGAAPAVDLSGLCRYDIGECGQIFAPNDGSYVLFDDVRALLAAAPVAPTAPTDISARLREYAGDPGYSHADYSDVMRTAADEIERYYGAMLAWKQTAETKDRKLSEEMRKRIDERVAARIAEGSPLTQAQIDHICEQWDGCMYDQGIISEGIDIGASIRAELAKIGGVK